MVAAQPWNGSVTAVLGESWEIFKTSPGLLIGVFLLWMIPGLIAGGIEAVLDAKGQKEAIVILNLGFQAINLFLIAPLMTCGFYNAMLKRLCGNPMAFEDFFPVALYQDRFLPWVLYILSAIVLVIAGLVCCVLPGLFILASIGLFGPGLLIDRRLGPWDAAIAAIRVGWKNFGTVLMACLLSFLLVILGVLACCVGLVVVLPLLQICFATLMYAKVFGVSTLR